MRRASSKELTSQQLWDRENHTTFAALNSTKKDSLYARQCLPSFKWLWFEIFFPVYRYSLHWQWPCLSSIRKIALNFFHMTPSSLMQFFRLHPMFILKLLQPNSQGYLYHLNGSVKTLLVAYFSRCPEKNKQFLSHSEMQYHFPGSRHYHWSIELH